MPKKITSKKYKKALAAELRLGIKQSKKDMADGIKCHNFDVALVEQERTHSFQFVLAIMDDVMKDLEEEL